MERIKKFFKSSTKKSKIFGALLVLSVLFIHKKGSESEGQKLPTSSRSLGAHVDVCNPVMQHRAHEGSLRPESQQLQEASSSEEQPKAVRGRRCSTRAGKWRMNRAMAYLFGVRGDEFDEATRSSTLADADGEHREVDTPEETVA